MNQQNPWTSRKLWVTIFGAVANLVITVGPWSVPIEALYALNSILGLYVGAEGVKDIMAVSQAAKAVKDNVAPPTPAPIVAPPAAPKP